jgi:hypothetical protein
MSAATSCAFDPADLDRLAASSLEALALTFGVFNVTHNATCREEQPQQVDEVRLAA